MLAGCGGTDTPPPDNPPVVIAEPEPNVEQDDLPVVAEPAPGKRPSPADEGMVGITPLISPGTCRAAPVAPRSAAGCSDAVGQPNDCSRVNLSGGCSSFSFICDKCESYKKHFKPKVAERAVNCVISQTKEELRDGCGTYACGDLALKSACPDAAAQSLCQTVAQQCGGPLHECTSLLSGMNAAGRAKVSACAARGCQFGLWSCIEGM